MVTAMRMRGFLFLLLAGGPGGAVLAQQQGSEESTAVPPTAVFGDVVEVNVVDLFATVTDRKGRPVSGLGRGDFQVFEDGEPREITNFEEVRRWVGGEPPPTQLRDPGVSRSQEHVAVVFDDSSLLARNRTRALAELKPFILSCFEHGDRVMVAVADPDPGVVCNFTSDVGNALEALERIEDLHPSGDQTKRFKLELKRDIVGSSPMECPSLWARVEALRWTELERLRRSLDAMETVVRGLAGAPGRKTLVWVCEDLGRLPAVDSFRLVAEKCHAQMPAGGGGDQLDLTDRLRRLTGTAHAAGVVIHAVDASDSYREGIGLAVMRGDTEGSQYLAGATGGTWFGNTRNLAKGFANIGSSLETYYSLGYTRPQPPDGKIHTVQVTVRGKGLKVRHHDRTWDRTEEQRLLDLTYSRLMLDQGDNPLEVRLEVGPDRAAAGGLEARDVEIRLPAESVVLVSGEDGPAANAVVAFQSSDARGVATEPALLEIRLRPGTDDAGRPMAVGGAELRFGAGARRLAVGVLDQISGIRSTTAVNLADL